ncbi:type II secretion system F family protein [Sinomonas sp. P10A9]|uniref:Type II secretion system F family protein n=1 Tax=Sinomonas puerhi TaxID=3238584 RepID=A0AB39L2U3_9MICC
MSTLLGAVAVSGALFVGWCLAVQRGGLLVRVPGIVGRGRTGAGAGGASRGFHGRLTGHRRRVKPAEPALELQRAALLVGQLAALLRAGRTPEQMWRQASQTRPRNSAPLRPSSPRGASPRSGTHSRGDVVIGSGTAERPEDAAEQSAAQGVGADASSHVLAAAAHAAALGRPVAAALREACARAASPGGKREGPSSAETGVWLSVAACIETAEASGSPLAGVLDRLAAQLEADADAAAARAVALAGPRATSQVLGVLPLAGLGLGILMGADPVGMLLSTPLGSLCLGLGFALTLAGRWWSARLLRSASESR